MKTDEMAAVDDGGNLFLRQSLGKTQLFSPTCISMSFDPIPGFLSEYCRSYMEVFDSVLLL